MESVLFVGAAEAALWGALHALIPCAHSWPMLVPFVREQGSAVRPALLFGAGQLAACLGVGAVVGSAANAIDASWRHRAEEVTGVLLLILGLVFVLTSRPAHFGHLHGACSPDDATDCGHRSHHALRLRRSGSAVGLFFLGAVTMFIPCWTNGAALLLAVASGGLAGAMVILGTFGLATALTMLVILLLFDRGLGLSTRLGSQKLETWILRLSGVILIGFGLSLVLHWHEH